MTSGYSGPRSWGLMTRIPTAAAGRGAVCRYGTAEGHDPLAIGAARVEGEDAMYTRAADNFPAR